MYEQSLTQAGLYWEQAQIYEVLIKNGPLEAGKIAKKTGITRSLVYKILEELTEKGLVIKDETSQKVTIFKPEHPLKLQELQEKMAQKAKNSQIALDTALPYLSSEFALLTDKPDIRFYEGKEGIKKVWWNSLTSTTEILTYGDLEILATKFTDLNSAYIKERKKLQIKKRAITNDSKFNREFLEKYDKDFTETKLIKNMPVNFSATIMQIYDNKISYTTLIQDKYIGIIVDNPFIYQMHRQLFEYNWQSLDKKSELKQPDSTATPLVQTQP